MSGFKVTTEVIRPMSHAALPPCRDASCFDCKVKGESVCVCVCMYVCHGAWRRPAGLPLMSRSVLMVCI